MRDLQSKCRIAVVQAAPVMFDKAACTEKAVSLIQEAAGKGAELIVFPELFIPCYPYGMTFGFTVGSRNADGRKDWKRYYDNSILVPGPETERLGQAAKAAGAYVSIGVSERTAESATLYNSNLFFSPQGELLCCHRKLKPTGAERVVWGDANREYFPVVDTPWGPMANDNEEWQATIRHIAIEGHCYFINCDMYFTREMYPKDLHCPEEIGRLSDTVCRGGSCVVDPYGHYVTEPVWDREEIIYAELDMDKVPASRMEFDACGHYARPDVLELIVHE